MADTRTEVIFAVGANIGYKTNFFLDIYPLATVYAFEPDPNRFQILEKNFADQPRVNDGNTAIYSREGGAAVH
jgi:FkbM family methyltransferase